MKLSNFKLRQEKGVAGTTVLLGLIVSLFVIGLLVMIFALMGSSLQTASYSSAGATNESKFTTGKIAFANQTGYTVNASLVDSSVLNCVATKVYVDWNQSNGSLLSIGGTPTGYNVTLATGNYSLSSAGVLRNATNYVFPNASVTYECDKPNTATNTIGNTTDALASTTDFFSLFIVIGSMVVLILLTVIIIVAIRQSGLLAEGTA